MGKDYKIGYGKPPEHSRFAKGRSGNPKGRPKGRKNLETDLDEMLGEKITIREGDQTRKVSKQLGFLLSLHARAVKGHGRSDIILLGLIDRLFDADGPCGNRLENLSQEERVVLALIKENLKPDGAAPEEKSDLGGTA